MSIKDSVTEIIHSRALLLNQEDVSEVIPRITPFFKRYPRIPSVINTKKVYPTFRILTDVDCDVLVLINDNLINSESILVELELNYEYFTYYEVFERILPQDILIPSSFEIVGSIIHLNLNDEQMKYKNIIGEVIHDKTNKTVITKVGQISNEYRFFDLEVIGGDDNLETTHREGDILFHIDYKHVYWCSKLQNERLNLLRMFKSGDVLCDLFCGVGPVSLAALKNGCEVYSNDLNPHAIECMKTSIGLNRLNQGNISMFNLPADEFLRSMSGIKVDHFFLNLPEYSLDYLRMISEFECEALIHCYFFCRRNEDVVEYIFKRTGFKVSHDMLRVVRKVSPSKDMYKLEIPRMLLISGLE